ncbi:hypothetical protein QYE76_003214 [Lolium multiflorum]|uniref:Uncharacterized protein n=1 Tax=Lolium multiflorum TaxID=4521 RepID=A0AAD8RPV1_LOLMU|nr:hypothetical protein QYE76_003214 [Lolium multiflorum]
MKHGGTPAKWQSTTNQAMMRHLLGTTWLGAMLKWASAFKKKPCRGTRCRRYKGGMAVADRKHVQRISRDRYYIGRGEQNPLAEGMHQRVQGTISDMARHLRHCPGHGHSVRPRSRQDARRGGQNQLAEGSRLDRQQMKHGDTPAKWQSTTNPAMMRHPLGTTWLGAMLKWASAFKKKPCRGTRHHAVIWVGTMPKWESASQKKAIGGSRRCRRYKGGMAAADRKHVQRISRDRYYIGRGEQNPLAEDMHQRVQGTISDMARHLRHCLGHGHSVRPRSRQDARRGGQNQLAEGSRLDRQQMKHGGTPAKWQSTTNPAMMRHPENPRQYADGTTR